MTNFLKRLFSPFMFWVSDDKDKNDKESSSDSSSDSSSSDSDDDSSVRKYTDSIYTRDWTETDSTAPPPYSEASYYMNNRTPPTKYARRSPPKIPSHFQHEFDRQALSLGFMPCKDFSDDDDDSYYNGLKTGKDQSFKNKSTRTKKFNDSTRESKNNKSPAAARKKPKLPSTSPKNYSPDNIYEMLQSSLQRINQRNVIRSNDIFYDIDRRIYHSDYVDRNDPEMMLNYSMHKKTRASYNVRPCTYDLKSQRRRDEIYSN